MVQKWQRKVTGNIRSLFWHSSHWRCQVSTDSSNEKLDHEEITKDYRGFRFLWIRQEGVEFPRENGNHQRRLITIKGERESANWQSQSHTVKKFIVFVMCEWFNFRHHKQLSNEVWPLHLRIPKRGQADRTKPFQEVGWSRQVTVWPGKEIVLCELPPSRTNRQRW